ncbi:hypothetical protein ACOMHN_038747 [Nucella lapillus]
MADKPNSKGSGPLKPTPPPKPTSAQTKQTKTLEDLTTRLTQLEERTTLLYGYQRTVQQSNSELTTEMSHLRSDFIDLKSDYSKLETDHKQLKTEHVKLQREHSEVKQKLDSLRLYLDAFQADHRKVKEDQDSLKKEIINITGELQAAINNLRIDCQTEMNNIRADQQTHVNNLRAEQQKMFAQKSDVVREMTSLREEMKSRLSDLASVKDTTYVEQLHTELCSLHSKFSENETNYNTAQADIAQLHADMDTITGGQKSLQAEVTKLKENQKKCITDQTNLKTEVSNLHTDQRTLHTDLDTITGGQSSLQADVIKLQKDHVDIVLAEQRQLQQNQDTLTSRVVTVQTDMDQMKTSLQQSLVKTSSDITALKTTLGKARELFTVCRLDRATTKQRQAMRFKTVLINDGGHYDHHSGMFTAPHAGLYFFTAGVLSVQVGISVSGHIVVDDDCHYAVHGGYQTGSGIVMLPLTTGQTVWMMAVNPMVAVQCIVFVTRKSTKDAKEWNSGKSSKIAVQ